jgi:hypothetical protein
LQKNKIFESFNAFLLGKLNKGKNSSLIEIERENASIKQKFTTKENDLLK